MNLRSSARNTRAPPWRHMPHMCPSLHREADMNAMKQAWQERNETKGYDQLCLADKVIDHWQRFPVAQTPIFSACVWEEAGTIGAPRGLIILPCSKLTELPCSRPQETHREISKHPHYKSSALFNWSFLPRMLIFLLPPSLRKPLL